MHVFWFDSKGLNAREEGTEASRGLKWVGYLFENQILSAWNLYIFFPLSPLFFHR